MKTNDFSFEIPDDLIAQSPAQRRGESRLMIVDRATGLIRDAVLFDLPAEISPGSVVVLNDTRVRKARLHAFSAETGGRVELLLLSRRSPAVWTALATKSRKQMKGKRFLLPGDVTATVVGDAPEGKLLEFQPPIDDGYLERHGSIPLPPYIRRPPGEADDRRYQTVYAREPGSAAAPTAGLHLTRPLIRELERREVEVVTLTLHVGLGTFAPIRSESIEEHEMHRESFHIPNRAADRIETALREGRDVVAVGTTVVRALESASDGGAIRRGRGETELFIRPGYRFRVVRRLFTNFHTPSSTLLVLVSAFASYDLVREAYRRAVERRYRFFSYGDAMLIK